MSTSYTIYAIGKNKLNVDKKSTQAIQTEDGNFSVNGVKNHINEVVHQFELTVVNSLTTQSLNASGSETSNLKLELQPLKDEKQQTKIIQSF